MTSRRLAFYGGTFDPVHVGHLAVAQYVTQEFSIDRFEFLPAFHAPHKPDSIPTSGFHRYAMLALATADLDRIGICSIELESGVKRYSIDTLADLNRMYPDEKIFFVMGADSWSDIRTWKRWDELLLATDHIVVSRPGFDLPTDHIPDEASRSIVDLRGLSEYERADAIGSHSSTKHIFLTDVVFEDVSATAIRNDISADDRLDDRDAVLSVVANYIEKYELYK